MSREAAAAMAERAAEIARRPGLDAEHFETAMHVQLLAGELLARAVPGEPVGEGT